MASMAMVGKADQPIIAPLSLAGELGTVASFGEDSA
jgi:hypothetical protein